ncbi:MULTISPECIES: hypothetical protein [Flavobacterium]|uniref:Uncharacterized protein n=1 Tax=Flavobacterium jumunjinense TaxID=998845 RepID=A0ABV5GP74_9FLAO|nr:MULTISPECIES: hypothetical protein [Flavobacterium]
MKNLKPNFSIDEIGKFRFYSGALIGIGFSIILNSLFRMTLRLCNLGMYIDQWNLNYEISVYYYTLIGFTSVGFAFCFTTYLWMSKPFAINRRKTLKLRMAQINPIWIFFGTLMFLLRMFWFLSGVKLTIEKDFPILGFMIPIFIYLYCWNLISDVYKSKKAFLISSLIFIIGGIILSGI